MLKLCKAQNNTTSRQIFKMIPPKVDNNILPSFGKSESTIENQEISHEKQRLSTWIKAGFKEAADVSKQSASESKSLESIINESKNLVRKQ